MTLLDCTILGEPVGQGRPRAVRSPFGVRMHPPKKSAEWQALAAQQFAAEWRRAPHTDACRLVVEAVNARSKSVPKYLGQGRRWRVGKPDLDNVIKAVADALVQGGVLRDDTLVAEIQAVSLVAAADEAPSTRVRVVALEPLAVVPWPSKMKAEA